ncbi:MAG: hypothetical protein QOI24_3388 [Acidobacteriota bacterium]|jgi:hypothetical protein|nr:hypothetical protein [Acidobacteriota bacterium]
MSGSLRVLAVTLCLLASAVAVNADCQLYECRTRVDTADCWIRLSGHWASAATCTGYCDCMPDPGNGNLYCECYCRMDYCYSV